MKKQHSKCISCGSFFLQMAAAITSTDQFDKNTGATSFEIFSIVWLDTHTNATDLRSTEQALRAIINHLIKFQNLPDCQKYVEDCSEKNRLVMIVSGQLGQRIVPSIHKFRQVISVYVYCMDKKRHEEWAYQFKKVKFLSVLTILTTFHVHCFL